MTRERLEPRDPAIDTALRALPAEAVLAEVPLGVVAYDLLAMYQSTRHWRPLVNGYSGHFPPEYAERGFALSRTHLNPKKAWDVLLASTATHAVVREWSRPPETAAWVRALWLERGAVPVAERGGEWLIWLPRR